MTFFFFLGGGGVEIFVDIYIFFFWGGGSFLNWIIFMGYLLKFKCSCVCSVINLHLYTLKTPLKHDLEGTL